MTSISVVREDDPEDMKEKYQKEYEQYSVDNVVATATDPKFKLYLYNEQGELVQENLSIHDIQHLLLHQTKKKFHRDSDNESDDEPDKSSGVSGIQEFGNSLQDLYQIAFAQHTCKMSINVPCDLYNVLYFSLPNLLNQLNQSRSTHHCFILLKRL